jgi:ubiquinone/menaquinone biosynthesis C-methylase UbiE
MGFYQHHLLPRLIDCACGLPRVAAQRRKLVPLARGEVLELGIGSGRNLPFYDTGQVRRLIGIDPSCELLERAGARASACGFPVELLRADAQALPLPAQSVDDVVVTYTLCSIAAVEQALAEARRVLKPRGRLLFCEHGLAPDAAVQRWQRTLAPLWQRLAGGCHLQRDAPQLLQRCGFRVDQLDAFYLPQTPRLLGFHTIGIASPL